MSLDGDYDSRDVPQEILDLVGLDNSINVDVLSMGAMAGTGLSDAAAESKGLIKNHWMWRFIVQVPGFGSKQIQFGFNMKNTPSVPSDQAHTLVAATGLSTPNSSGPGAVSIRSLGSDKGVRFDDLSSINKPPAALSTHNAPSIVHAPSIRSSLGGIIQQPFRGPRVPGTFDIIVRSRIEPSWSHRFTRSFRLAPGTTFGQLFHSVASRGMEPFHFPQVEFARFGCRDGISQLAGAWLADGLLLDGICRERIHTHIYDLLCWRYSQPEISGAVTTSDEEEEEGAPKIKGFSSARSYIDRAVWPEGYTHVEHPKLLFTRPPDV